MDSRALTRGGPPRFVTVAAALAAFTVAASPVEATAHNARVAEYLLYQHLDARQHNARVAEYLLERGDW